MALLEELPPDQITVELVLSRSGFSKGSLYHHYRDFNHLIDLAQVTRFAAFVDASVQMIDKVLAESTTREECYAGIVAVTSATQSPINAGKRSTRVWALGQAGLRDTMRTALGAEQQRLTDALASQVRTAQDRGWFRAELDPQTVAVFIQAYTVGRVVDDVATEQVAPEHWESLVNLIIADVFMGDPSLAAT